MDTKYNGWCGTEAGGRTDGPCVPHVGVGGGGLFSIFAIRADCTARPRDCKIIVIEVGETGA